MKRAFQLPRCYVIQAQRARLVSFPSCCSPVSFFNLLSFFIFSLLPSSLYDTSPAPSASAWSSLPASSPCLASPTRPVLQSATPSLWLGPAVVGSQPTSPRYRPYTLSTPWGPSSAPRSSGVSTLSSSPSVSAPASTPQATPASWSIQRSPDGGPPVLSTSPSHGTSFQRISPRY